MSKQKETKDREKTLPEKLRQLFKLGKDKSLQLHGSAVVGDPRHASTSYEYALANQTIKDLSVHSPQSVRLKTLKDLTEIVVCHRLEEHAVEKLWTETSDLLGQTVDVRHQVLKFFSHLIKGQPHMTGILRAHFFFFIRDHNIAEDISLRLELFRNLSENGKNIMSFEEQTGVFLLKWMPEILSAGKTCHFLPILINVIKYNAAYLDEEIVARLVMHTCILSSRTIYEDDIKLCLDVLEAIVCYSFLPNAALLYYIEALCRVVNNAKFPDNSLRLMKKFLGTHLGHSGIYAMCKILQEKQYRADYMLLRGAVFFIGMFLWGHQKVQSLKHSPSSVLPSFLSAMNCGNTYVVREVLLSVDRLVRKYGHLLQLLTWELVVDILDRLIDHIQEKASSSELKMVESQLHNTLTAIEDLNDTNEYMGSVDRLYNLIEKVSKTRPESSVIKLIQYESQLFYPTQDGWIDNLVRLMERYYRNESRTNIRIKTLNVLSSVLCATRYLYEDELIDSVVGVNFNDLNTDPDKIVRNVAVQLIVDLAVDCNSKKCFDLLEIIKRVIGHPFGINKQTGVDMVHIMDESELADVKTGIQGLIEIVQRKIVGLKSVFAVTAHKHLISHITSHYENPVVFEQASSSRFMVMKYLLHIRANSLRQIGVLNFDETSAKNIEYSSHLLCSFTGRGADESGARILANPKAPLSFPSCPVTYLSMVPAFNAIITCLQKERDWIVLKLALRKMPLILQNKTLMLSSDKTIEALCLSLCNMVSKNGQLENLQNRPEKFNRSDFHSFVFPALAAFASYNKYLSGSMQKMLVKCLEFGLVSRCASICINALTDCTLEMQDIMYKLLPEVLLNLSKISATTGIASAILEFLSTLIMLPSLYTSFVENQYMSIFAIALPYTNPFKFNHYIVSLAHHVIAIWFLKCRLPYRRNFVKFISKGLDANVVTLVEDNSEANSRRRSSSLNEAQSPTHSQLSSKRQSLHPGSGGKERSIADSPKSPLDEAMMKFHLELTDTCLDFMARYAFSTCSALPYRTPLAEFLLKGGQTASWLIGTTIIIITTSGCGSKVLRQGLCQECYQLCRKPTDSFTDSSEELISSQKSNVDTNSRIRRRHQSAAIVGSDSPNMPLLSSTGTKDDIIVGSPRTSGSLLLEPVESRSRKNTSSSCDSNKSNEAVLTHSVDEPEAQNIDKLLFGADKSDDGSTKPRDSHPSHLCSCWCQGWAEIQIRRPTGNTAWMMRIQNLPNLVSSTPSDFPLADIASLFLPSKMDNISESSFEMYNVSSHKRIDSESLGENEYEAIYQEHFESESPSKKSLKDAEFGPCPDSPKSQNQPKDSDKTTKKDDNNEDNATAVPKSPRKLERIGTIHEGQTSNGRSSIDTKEKRTSSRLMPSSPPLAIRQTKSPPMSPQYTKDVSQPAFRGRVHTISVMTPVASTSQFPRSTNSLKREIYKTGINPSFVFLQLYHIGYFGSKTGRPLKLPKNETMTRALDCLNFIPPYETHKMGIIYVDEDQVDDEIAILSNEYGSVRYMNFLEGIGTLIRFKDLDRRTTYVGGLDLSEDGKFTYLWHDDIMQVLFHVATLMPTTKDPSCSNKKRHIGNDYVFIVYNDSGKPFKLSTIKGQFSYACVVIEPVDHQSNIVTIQVKPDMVDIIGYREPKIVSDQNLAIVVRQMALHANLASRIHKSQISIAANPFASNWLERLRQIKRLRQKVIDHYASCGENDEFPASSKSSPTSTDFTDYA